MCATSFLPFLPNCFGFSIHSSLTITASTQGDSVFAEPGLDLEDGKWFQPLMADMEMDENMSFDFDDNDFEERMIRWNMFIMNSF